MFKKLLVIAVLCMSTAHAQSDRPITLVVGFPPGTGNDLAARQVAKDITTLGGPAIVIENKVGNSGNIAINEVVNSKDAKLLLHSNSIYVNSYLTKTSTLDPGRQLRPVSFVGTVPMVLETGKDSDLYTLSDIVRSKRKLAYGSGGVGSLPHTNMAYISHILATPMTHIPYQGAARSLTDLSAGRIDLCFDFYNSSRPLIQDGRIRPLAVSTNQRLKDLPDVPTLKEKGINWPLESFYMLYASTNIDPELVKRLQTLLNQAYKQNASAYEAQGIQLDPTKNKDIEKFHFDTIRHYQNLKFPLDINEKS